jgi:hypothetical protein
VSLDGARAALRTRVRQELAKKSRRAFPCPSFETDPIAFCRDVLRFDPWDLQAEWIRALVPESAAVSVASGHKTGKSSGAAGACLWYWGTRRRARVVLMAPKIEHIEIVLWPEIRRMYLAAGRCAACLVKLADKEAKHPPPCDRCSPLGDPSWIGVDPTKGLRAPDGREIFAYTSRKADAIGGISGPEMLFVFDEASGIDDQVWEAMKGNEAGGARKLLLGNPLRTRGEFFESHHRAKRFYSYVARISSEDTPNARSGEKLIPGLAERPWCEKRAEEWGKDSVLYAVRVKGEFPSVEEGQLVSFGQLEAAERRWEGSPAVGRLQLGVDVAFTSDDAAIAARRGAKIFEVVRLNGLDEEDLAERVVGIARAHARERDSAKPIVLYDSNGPGARLGKALRAYSDEIEIKPINGTWRPTRPREYHQLRDEIADNFAKWLKADGAIPSDGKLEGEIDAMRVFDAGAGRRRTLSNEETKKLLKRSPDSRNACELAVWEPWSVQSTEAQPPPVREETGDPFVAGSIDPYVGISPYGVGISPYGGGSGS